MKLFGSSIGRHQLILGVIFAAASAVFLFVVYHFGIESEVVRGYLPYANEVMNGNIPSMEYPPFALIFITIPRLFTSDPFIYEILFVAQTFVFFVAGMVVISKLAKRFRQSQHLSMIIYTVLMLLMFEFVVDRYDIFPAVLTLISFYFFVTKRYAWAFVFLSIATMTKLYPAVLFPIFLIPLIFDKDWKNALKGSGLFILTALAIAVPFFIFGSDALFGFLTSNVDRALQIESTPASIFAFLHMLGLADVSIAPFEPGVPGSSDNLVGPLPDAIAPFMNYVMMVAVIAVYILYAFCLRKLRRDGPDNEDNRMLLFGGATVLALLAFMIFGKVFSSQYLIWVIPFIVILLMSKVDPVYKRNVLFLSIIAIFLTQVNFAVNIGISGGGTGITDAGMLLILARNIVMIVLFAYVIWFPSDHLRRKREQAQAAEEAPAPQEVQEEQVNT